MKEGKLMFCNQSNRQYEYIYTESIRKLNFKHSLPCHRVTEGRGKHLLCQACGRRKVVVNGTGKKINEQIPAYRWLRYRKIRYYHGGNDVAYHIPFEEDHYWEQVLAVWNEEVLMGGRGRTAGSRLWLNLIRQHDQERISWNMFIEDRQKCRQAWCKQVFKVQCNLVTSSTTTQRSEVALRMTA